VVFVVWSGDFINIWKLLSWWVSKHSLESAFIGFDNAVNKSE